MLVCYFLGAQESNPEEVKLWTIYPGYVITHDLDTIHGFIKLNNLVDNQKKALFYNSPDDEKYVERYKPKHIKGYKVGFRCYESFKFWPEKEANALHFFLKVIDGPITLYQWYYEPQSRTDERVKIDEDNLMNSEIDLSFSEEDLSTELISIKNDDKPQQLDNLKFLTNFKKNGSKYFQDYPELAEKIANKEEGYRWENLKEIILEYNVWYLANH
jgi:hypothetical protein